MPVALAAEAAVDCRLLKASEDYYFIEKGPFVHAVAHGWGEKGTVANWLLHLDPRQGKVGRPLEAGLAHRLDYETSGVMVAARNEPALAHLKKCLASGQVTKEYLCLTERAPPIGRHEAWAGKHPKSAKRVRIVAKSRRAKPGFRTVITEILSCRQQGAHYRVRVNLITGYRHQIRAHLEFLGCPIVGDKIYGGAPADRLMLHARTVAFQDAAGRGLHAKADPSWFHGRPFL
jgi:23S rRNA pseudouridine1911/1915/1917 synthase